MTRPRRATEPEITAALATLPGWERRGDAIVRTFTFVDFGAAIAFMTEVAAHAEELDHHPDWRNVHRRVEVLLTTHDRGGLTTLDFELARRMDAAAGR